MSGHAFVTDMQTATEVERPSLDSSNAQCHRLRAQGFQRSKSRGNLKSPHPRLCAPSSTPTSFSTPKADACGEFLRHQSWGPGNPTFNTSQERVHPPSPHCPCFVIPSEKPAEVSLPASPVLLPPLVYPTALSSCPAAWGCGPTILSPGCSGRLGGLKDQKSGREDTSGNL